VRAGIVRKAVVSFLGQYYSPQDLQQFQKQYGTPVLPIERTFGPNDPANPGVEASLDVQYLTGVTGADRGSSGTYLAFRQTPADAVTAWEEC
jgi:tripeptidyl-peptidase-1